MALIDFVSDMRSVVTLISMATFIGIVLWAYSAKRKDDFDEAARLPFADEEDLNKTEMTVNKINWIKYDGFSEGMEAITKIRYKDKGALSKLTASENGVNVVFYDNVKGIAPGQSAVFYEGDDVIVPNYTINHNCAFFIY